MSKVFDIDGVKITISDKLFSEACRVYILEDENNLIASDTIEECRRSNYLYLSNAIEAGFTYSLNDLGKVKIEDIVKKYSSEEISKHVEKIIRQSIERNGGNYNI